MATLKVECITRDSSDLDRRIDAIGGVGFYHLIDRAIRESQNGSNIYYTTVRGEVALIVVRKHPTSGLLFLQTVADQYPHNNLLHLPECR